MKTKDKKKKSLNIKLIYLIFICLVIVVAVIVAFNMLQRDSFFHPTHDKEAYKKLKSISEFEEIKIKDHDVNLSGWFWNIQGKDKAPLIIFFVGNAQNSSGTFYNFYQNDLKKYFGDYNIMIVDYPGYGLSKGKPSEESFFEAAEHIVSFAKKMEKVDSDNIVIMGYSIGTGVACYTAKSFDVKGLILVAPYDKALSLYQESSSSFKGSGQSLAKYKFDSLSYAINIDEPTIIITSKDDEVIGYKYSENLSKNFKNLYKIQLLEGIDHNSYFNSIIVLNEINDFLNSL